MTLLQFLQKVLGIDAGAIVAVLNQVIAAGGDAAVVAQQFLAQLEAELNVTDLAGAVASLPAEALNIIKGHLEPKDHPSDAA